MENDLSSIADKLSGHKYAWHTRLIIIFII